jgi:PAS domain S-box-containing protein
MIRTHEPPFPAASNISHDSFLILESARGHDKQIYDFRFTFANLNGAKLFSSTPQALKGKLLSESYPVNRSHGFIDKYRRVVETGESLVDELFVDADVINATWLRYQVLKLDDGVAITLQDISERKGFEANLIRINEQLRESEARLQETQHLAKLGNWEIDIVSMAMRWSDEVFRIFDRDSGAGPLSIAEVIDRIDPDDLDRLQSSIQLILRSDETRDLHCKLNDGAGSIRYLHSRARRHCDPDGVVTHLSGTLMDVSDKIRLHDALNASDSRFEAYMEDNPALAFIKDRAGNILYMNKTGRRLCNFDNLDWKGKSSAELWPPNVASEMGSLDLEVLNTGNPTSRVVLLPTSHGGTNTFLTCNFPFHVPDQEFLLGAVAMDISEQQAAEKQMRQALADKEILFKEVNHRIKNNLQVISSLLAMQAANVDEPSIALALHDSQSRVQSMAMIHEMLYSLGTPQAIDFRIYCERLLGELLTSYGASLDRIRGHVNVGDLKLGMDHAIPCGLILNELISNCLKYAFPDGEGDIYVSLVQLEQGGCQLVVADNGIGLPPHFSHEGKNSLGLHIVKILARQLGATFDYSSANGCKFQLNFPVSSSIGKGSLQAASS